VEHSAIDGAEYGLIVQQPGKSQEILRSFVAPMLNFRYGLQTIEAPIFREAAPAIRDHAGGMRCAFLIQNRALRSDVGISGLNLMGKYPLFALVPENLAKTYEATCSKMKNAFVISWEQAFDKRGSLLQEMVENIFANNGIGKPFEDHKIASYDKLQQQVEARLSGLAALPPMPGMIRRIMPGMVGSRDPDRGTGARPVHRSSGGAEDLPGRQLTCIRWSAERTELEGCHRAPGPQGGWGHRHADHDHQQLRTEQLKLVRYAKILGSLSLLCNGSRQTFQEWNR